ncbi:MAG: iron ABC transporter permease [Desulfobacteraceae bacterium]|nr:iron ABC transporter permease [Desulfobacteraceae bacterium]
MNERTIKAAYFRQIHRKIMLLAVFGGLILIVGIFGLTHGSYDITLTDILWAMTGGGDDTVRLVVADIRLPRIVAAIVCGWGMALSGLGIQSLLKNPLGSPATLGISQGAAFGAALSVVVMGSQLVSVTVYAFAGAMGATFIILVLARLKQLSAEAVILAGVALSSLFGSATILMQYLATETELAMVVFWTFGDVARSTWQEIRILGITVVLMSGFFICLRWDLNAMASGEETARGLGVRVERLRMLGMTAAALMAALVTAFHGVIAFVGLIAPHMARRLAGEEHGLLIPYTAVLGSLLLLTADTLGRVLAGSGSLPVGVVTSFLGAPMFLYLLVRGYK